MPFALGERGLRGAVLLGLLRLLGDEALHLLALGGHGDAHAPAGAARAASESQCGHAGLLVVRRWGCAL